MHVVFAGDSTYNASSNTASVLVIRKFLRLILLPEPLSEDV